MLNRINDLTHLSICLLSRSRFPQSCNETPVTLSIAGSYDAHPISTRPRKPGQMLAVLDANGRNAFISDPSGPRFILVLFANRRAA